MDDTRALSKMRSVAMRGLALVFWVEIAPTDLGAVDRNMKDVSSALNCARMK
jgi:hypothetical protein